MQIVSHLLLATKVKYKKIKDLNIKPDSLNPVEDNIGDSLESIGTGDWS